MHCNLHGKTILENGKIWVTVSPACPPPPPPGIFDLARSGANPKEYTPVPRGVAGSPLGGGGGVHGRILVHVEPRSKLLGVHMPHAGYMPGYPPPPPP